MLVINPHTHRIEKRLAAGDGKTYLFLNLAEDPATGRLFVTDDSKAKTTLVFDERSGKVIKRIDCDALGIHTSVLLSCGEGCPRKFAHKSFPPPRRNLLKIEKSACRQTAKCR